MDNIVAARPELLIIDRPGYSQHYGYLCAPLIPIDMVKTVKPKRQ